MPSLRDEVSMLCSVNEQSLHAAGSVKETLVFGEHYVPRDQLLNFMQQARGVFCAIGTEVIYSPARGTSITATTLPQARAGRRERAICRRNLPGRL